MLNIVLVCHCHVVNDREIEAAVLDGACDAAAVAVCTGAGSDCGGCVSRVVELIEGVVASQWAAAS
jgi:bacterioferritin-associated ferredoxin